MNCYSICSFVVLDPRFKHVDLVSYNIHIIGLIFFIVEAVKKTKGHLNHVDLLCIVLKALTKNG